MELIIDEATAASLRQGQKLLIAELKKALKKAEDLDEIHAPTRFYYDQIDLAGATLRLLDDQTDIVAEERTRRGVVDPSSNGQMTLDEAVDGAEKEAARVLRTEQRRALARAVGAAEDGTVPVPDGAAEMDDQAIAVWLLDVWEGIEYVDEVEEAEGAARARWPQVIRHAVEPPDSAGEDTPVRVVWCAVRSDAGVPRFWYDIDPETFDGTSLAPTFQGEALFREVRRAWGVLPEEREPEVRAETDQPPAEDDEISAWLDRTRPEPTLDSATSILLAGAHEILGSSEFITDLRQYWENGWSDDQLRGLLASEPPRSTSVAVPSIGGQEEFVAVEFTPEPLALVMKRGRKKEALKDAQLVTAIRAMLEIPEAAAESTEAHEDGDAEPAAVGAGDDELPF